MVRLCSPVRCVQKVMGAYSAQVELGFVYVETRHTVVCTEWEVRDQVMCLLLEVPVPASYTVAVSLEPDVPDKVGVFPMELDQPVAAVPCIPLPP